MENNKNFDNLSGMRIDHAKSLEKFVSIKFPEILEICRRINEPINVKATVFCSIKNMPFHLILEYAPDTDKLVLYRYGGTAEITKNSYTFKDIDEHNTRTCDWYLVAHLMFLGEKMLLDYLKSIEFEIDSVVNFGNEE